MLPPSQRGTGTAQDRGWAERLRDGVKERWRSLFVGKDAETYPR